MAAGYARQLIGVEDGVRPSQLPAYVTEEDPLGFNDAPGDLDMIGNGVRLAVGASRALGRRLSLSLELRGDVMRFGTASYAGVDFRLRRSGWSFSPGLTMQLAWHTRSPR